MIYETLVINGQDFSPILDSYVVAEETKYDSVITTFDGTEHERGRKMRDIIRFRLIPAPEREDVDYRALTAEPLIVKYSKGNQTKEQVFRLDCDLEKRYLLKSCDGYRRYAGGEICLRAKRVN